MDTVLQFICDSMLGRLAKNLRMLGLDTLYARDARLKDIVQTAAQQRRILLTRRSEILKIKQLPAPFIFIASNEPAEQLQEVLSARSLQEADFKPLSLCLRCNARLKPVEKESARGAVPEYIFAAFAEFSCCPECGRIYWRGTHYSALQRIISGFASRPKIK